jgi:hypothetical protein
MVLDVNIGTGSLTIEIPNPFQLDLDGICGQIEEFAASRDAEIEELDIPGLIPRLVKGIAGCEGGCPANARSLVRSGFKNFELEYVEGGILVAHAPLNGAARISLKMFPEF